MRLDKADVIVCIDADLFGTHPNAVRYAHDFAKRRDAADGKMNRLYVVESCYTITGAMADHRLALRNQHIGAFVEQLAAELRHATHRTHRKNQPSEATRQAAEREPSGRTFLAGIGPRYAFAPRKVRIVVGSRQPRAGGVADLETE